MYEKVVGHIVKIVYQDGDKISVSKGKVLSYNKEFKTISIMCDKKQREIFIPASEFKKLEVIERG